VEHDGYQQLLRWLELLEKRKPADYFNDVANLPAPKGEPAERGEPRRAAA